ncbi:cytochrome b [Massilia sp. PWRC2]|uniref:cytochrome b n=1 Tax=Massilia sp. PWRC2 TaxID=2804626 RepID=UPI003CF9FC0F
MRLRDSAHAYGAVSRINHWLGALLILAMLAIGLVFIDLPTGSARTFWRTLHIAIGTSLLPLVALRIGWRLLSRTPTPLMALARTAHLLLMVTLAAMLVSGVLMQWFGGRPIGVFDLIRFASPLAASPLWQERMEQLHGVLAWCLIGLIALHVLGLLVHSATVGRAFWARMAGRAPRR